MERNEELWRQCVTWLIGTGVLPRQHKTAFRDAQVFDLAQTLRDGVVLCNLLNVIKPGAVDLSRINIRPQMLQFLCVQNLQTVISSLLNVFGIPEHEVFLAHDLYNMTNFRKVLKVLSLLSHSQASCSKFRPFPLDTGQQRIHRSEEEEDIYRTLPDLASERELIDEEDNLYDSVPEEDKEEGIYGTVIAVKRQKSTSTLPKDKRTYCINEICETEHNYVLHLQMMLHKFIEPLKGTTFDDKDIRIIFSNTDQLVPIHEQFLKSLESAKNDNMMRMSQPFIKFKDRFLKYGVYCSNLQDALSYLADMWKDDRTRERIEDCQNKASPSKFKLRELLCVSMQRVLKYHLLIRELHKHTSESHVDREDLGKALEAMQELSHYVNEVKRDREMLSTINKVEGCLSDYSMQIPLSSYGRLLKDGDLKIKSSTDNKSKARFTYLFDQALFMTSLKNDKYKLKDLVRLEDCQLDETPQTKATKWSWNWTLRDKHGSRCYTLSAKTEGDKMRWLENIKTAFETIRPSCLKGKQHYFKITSFKEPTYCFHCNKLLLGSFFQGYMCERTNKACHKLCLLDAWKRIDSSADAPQPNKRPIPQPPPPSTPNRHQSAGLYKAHRDYNGRPSPPFPGAVYIVFSIGEQIEVDEKITADWWMGRSLSLYDRKGYFPASCVSPMTSRSSKTSNYIPADISSGPVQVVERPGTTRMTSKLEDASWYAGVADRNEAEKLLSGKPSGTFLVRTREGNLAISLIYQTDVKHIRILQSQNMFYVAESKNFKSIQELVKFYQENLMNTSFLGLDTTLKFPYRDPRFFPGMPGPNMPNTQLHRRSVPNLAPPRPSKPVNRNFTFSHRANPESPSRRPNGLPQITVDNRSYDVLGTARVLFDFEPRSTHELGLRADQVVNIISKAGDSHGWWKGEYDGRVGYFPSAFIEELDIGS